MELCLAVIQISVSNVINFLFIDDQSKNTCRLFLKRPTT